MSDKDKSVEYLVEDILRLVAIRIEILKAKLVREEDIEADIRGYLLALTNPTPELKRFTDRQKMFGKYIFRFNEKMRSETIENFLWKKPWK